MGTNKGLIAVVAILIVIIAVLLFRKKPVPNYYNLGFTQDAVVCNMSAPANIDCFAIDMTESGFTQKLRAMMQKKVVKDKEILEVARKVIGRPVETNADLNEFINAIKTSA